MWHFSTLMFPTGALITKGTCLELLVLTGISSQPRRVYYITYNPKTDGDYRLAYYEDKRKAFPPDVERELGKDYSAGGRVYNVGNPIPNSTNM